MKTPDFFPPIAQLIHEITENPPQVSAERMALLERLGDYIRHKNQQGQPIRLNFICTHNSRRSHLGQIWALVWASYFGYEELEAFSGGTEATAFHPNAIAALENQGFEITGEGEINPRYEVRFSPDSQPVVCWSKMFHDPANPAQEFAAIMVCDSAAEACPVVPGAEKRIPIEFRDPKESDGTAAQDDTYRARSRQIAEELFLTFQYSTS